VQDVPPFHFSSRKKKKGAKRGKRGQGLSRPALLNLNSTAQTPKKKEGGEKKKDAAKKSRDGLHIGLFPLAGERESKRRGERS